MPSVADSRFKFIPLAGQAGKERDSETNLDYFGARYYSWRGQWLQVDPLRDKYAGWSGYNYVEDNPLLNIDPNGLDWFKYKDKNEKEENWHWQNGSTYKLNIGTAKSGCRLARYD